MQFIPMLMRKDTIVRLPHMFKENLRLGPAPFLC